ncbi:MAG: UDP-glucuronic acid decarboxylase family protein [bacterium]
MRVVVTGGAGFIGSHLCERLLKEGHEVVCLDNLITGRADNVAHLLGARFTMIQYDITNFISVAGGVDAILHFASPASPIDYIKLPIQTLKVGALGTHKALGLARAKGSKFLLASTSEVYGDPLEHPQRESYRGNVNPVGPRGVYDEAKRFAEAMTTAYHKVHGVSTRIARIFNTYGPRMRLDDGRAIPTFITRAIRGEPIPVFGSGAQTRSFCYIDDMVDGIMRLLDSDLAEPVNLGNPDEHTILELAEMIIGLTGSRSRLERQPLPDDDPKCRQPDVSKARATLGWRPAVPLEEGLRRTIEYIRIEMG